MLRVQEMTSFTQVKFHLDKGRLLTLPVSWFTSIHLRKLAENNYELALVPMYGYAKLYRGDEKAIEDYTNEFTFYLIEGAGLQTKRNNILDNIFSWFQDRFSKGR